ncbi:MAG TPA: hypothetical protein VK968_20480, partial [Roseimicrobium sp.]|nr:hypothetical protein [Roseimicrobium sp.]
PVIIGAKKGLPNLNELSLQTVVKVSRRLEFRKAATNQPPNQTNQMFVIGISNVLGVEAWNSYTSAYPRPLTMRVTNLLTLAITNAAGTNIWPTAGFPIGTNASAFGSIAAATWLGAPSSQAFKVPMNGTFNFMPDSQYYFAADTFVPTTNTLVSHAFETGQGFYLPKWTLAVSNRLTYALVDATYDRVVDFVTLDNLNFGTDISSVLSSLGAQGSLANMWDTNRVGGSVSTAVMPIGVQNQILSSQGFPVPSDTDWANFNTTTPTKNDAINRFRVYMGLTQLAGAPTLTAAQQAQVRSSNVWVAPFTPSAVIYNRTSWAANDPLVHYTVSDLTDNFYGNSTNQSLSLGQVKLTGIPQSNLGKLNFDPSSGVYRYNPWGGPRNPGGTPLAPGDTSGTYFNVALKDAGVRWPDDWQFPSNRFSSIGQLGRVHRGTPWQTIYLKAGVADKALWQKWNTSDATHPTNDWTIIDLFTAAPDDNSQRGLLSINQANEAAWAAVLGGVRVLYNTNDYNAAPGIASQSGLTPMTIDPATPQLKDLVDSINLYRESLTNQIPSQTFTNLGQILGVPRLTIGLNGSGANEFSPYLTNSLLSPYDASDKNLQEGVNDVVLERIPEQVLSLLTVERYPRIVVYAFGQALKPAERSLILTPGPSRGVCTNYQITGEVITRTVLRFEGAPTNSMRAVVESYNVLSSY